MTRRELPFSQVDVFGSEAFLGNPVAVVHDADDLDDTLLQTIARWTNLSETVFLLRPNQSGADYRLRIFTPSTELPFAGHPTLGAAHAWSSREGGLSASEPLVQECGAGLVRVRRVADGFAFAAPPTTRDGDLEARDLDPLLDALGLDPSSVVAHQWVDNGPGWAALLLPTAADVLAVVPDASRLRGAMVGLVGPCPAGSSAAYEVRAFAPGLGMLEDPVTGSLNASVAQWLIRRGEGRDAWTVAQGRRVGRSGEVRIEVRAGHVWVGGATRTLVTGSLAV